MNPQHLATIVEQLSAEVLRERYLLLCRASQLEEAGAPSEQDVEVAADLQQLQQLLQHDLLQLAQQGNPERFTRIWQDMTRELERLRIFSAFPDLGRKRVVGVGGAFSAGKSTFLNALLGRRLLATEVDPTTSLPAYLLQGAQEEIIALNLFGRRLPLTAAEFQTLTHDELEQYGTQVGAMLRLALIRLPDLRWSHLAFLDTPGYSKAEQRQSERTDAARAREQLNSAQFLIWVVSAEAGTIPEADMEFLGSLRRDIPRLVILSRADKRNPEDVAGIVEQVRQTLRERGLPVLDVLPFSRNRGLYPDTRLQEYLQAWDQTPHAPDFAIQFKRAFMGCQSMFEIEQHKLKWNLQLLNHLLSQSDQAAGSGETRSLLDLTRIQLRNVKKMLADLQDLQAQFFTLLQKVGHATGMKLPGPEEIRWLQPPMLDVLELLQQCRVPEKHDLPDRLQPHWEILLQDAQPRNTEHLLRKHERSGYFQSL